MPLLLVLVLALAASPLLAAGTELAPRTYGPSTYSIHWLRSVASSDGFLTVWQQDDFGGGMALYGSLAGADGQAGAVSGLRIAEGRLEWIALTASGADFLVFYGTPAGRWLVKVSADGTVGTAKELDLPRTFYPVAALSGDRILLAGYPAAGLPYAGYIFDTAGNRLTDAFALGSGWRYPRPVGTRDGFVLSWAEETRVLAQFLSRDGEAGPVVELHTDPTTPFPPPVYSAENGGEALVVWRMSWQQPWLYGAAAFGPGGSIARSTFEVDRRYGAANPIGVVRSGAGYALLTQDQAGLNAQRLDRGGRTLGATTPLQQPSPGFIDIVSNGRTIFGTGSHAVDFVGRYIAGTGYDATALTPRSTHIVSRITTRHTDIDIASAGSAFLATWVDRSVGSQTIQTVLVASDGTPRSPVFDHGRSTGILGAPAIASSGQEYLVVWWHGQAIYGVFVGVDGFPLDATPFVIHQGTGSLVDVAWTGSAYIAGWAEAGVLQTAIVSRARIVSRAQKISTGIAPPAGHTAEVVEVDLAWNGRHLLAVLRHEVHRMATFPTFYPPEQNILAMRLSASGMQRDAIATDLGPGWRGSVTASESDFVVAVEEPTVTREVLLRTDDGIEIVRSTPLLLGRPYVADIAPGGIAARYYLDGRHLLVLVRDGYRSEVEIGGIELMQPPAVATNDFGETVIVVTEFRDGVGPRAVGYAAGELTLRGRRRAI